MHIDTNAQNCNFLSEFVSLRGSLSCQWIVRCAALSPFLPLSISLSRSLSPTLLHYAYMSVSRKRISPLTAVKCTNQMEEAYKENMVEKMFFKSYFSSYFLSSQIYRFKCELIVCFHKQVLCNTVEHLCAKNLNLSQ